MDSLDVFEVLVREHSRMLTAYLRSAVADPGAVDDLWQETMLTAWRRWSDYDRSRPFGAWLRGIARNNVLAWRRSRARQDVPTDVSELDYLDNVFTRIHQQDGATFEEQMSTLRSCVQSLPDRYRHVVELRYEESLMPSAIAERQARKLETIKKQLQRARALLFDCITRKLDLSVSQT